jgi:hypothetical protein
MSKLVIAGLAAPIIVFSAPALAQSSTADCQEMFSRADVNNDGLLHADEAKAFIERAVQNQVKLSDVSNISYEEFIMACRKGYFTEVNATPTDPAATVTGQNEKSAGENKADNELVPWSSAADQEVSTNELTEQPAEQALEIPEGLRATDLLGTTVYSRENANIGKIRDLTVTDGAETPTQVIIGVGGFLGMGEKRVAVEISQLTFGTRGKDLMVVLNTAPADLEVFGTAGQQ